MKLLTPLLLTFILLNAVTLKSEQPCKSPQAGCPTHTPSQAHPKTPIVKEVNHVISENTKTKEEEVSILEEEIETIESLIAEYERKLALLKRLRKSGGDALDFKIKAALLDDLVLQNKGPFGMNELTKPRVRPDPETSARTLKKSLFLKETKSISEKIELLSISPIKSMAGSRLNQLSFGLFHASSSYLDGRAISHVGLSDLYLNEVLRFNISAPLKFLKSSPQYDDIFALSVTQQDTVLLTSIRMTNLKSLQQQRLKGMQLPKEEQIKQNFKNEASVQTKRAFGMYHFEVEEETSFAFQFSQEIGQKDEATITAVQVFQQKGRKFVVLGDSKGRLSLLDRDGKLARKTFETGVTHINALKAHSGPPMAISSGNVMYAGLHSIGVAKVLEGEVHTAACEAGSASREIKILEADVGIPGVIYAGLEGGQVYVFELKTAGHVSFECNIVTILAPVVTKQREATDEQNEEEDATATSLISLKGGLVIQRANGKLEIWNATSVNSLQDNQFAVIEESEMGAILTANRHIRGQFLTRAFKKNEMGLLEVWEWKAPTSKEASSMLESLGASKIPIVLGIVIVVAYQLYKRKRSQAEEKYSPDRKKMEDLRELQNLLKATKEQQGIGGAGRGGRRNEHLFKRQEDALNDMEARIDHLSRRTQRSTLRPVDEDEDSY